MLYPHSRRPPLCRGQEAPPADPLPPHIYSHRKFPQPACVHDWNKFTSLVALQLTHTLSAERLTSISQQSVFSVHSTYRYIKKYTPFILPCTAFWLLLMFQMKEINWHTWNEHHWAFFLKISAVSFRDKKYNVTIPVMTPNVCNRDKRLSKSATLPCSRTV